MLMKFAQVDGMDVINRNESTLKEVIVRTSMKVRLNLVMIKWVKSHIKG